MNTQFYPDTLPQKTARFINDLASSPPDFLQSFYLSGGTALALQIGHRESEDLDFFSKESFDPTVIGKQLSVYGNLTDVQSETGTLNTFLNGVKLQFLHYPYKLIKPLIIWNHLNISSILDIACTKLLTISARGNKKDFIDLYFLLEIYPLIKLFQALENKYQGIDYSQTHILKSLVYFTDADAQPIPKMHKNISWNDVKNRIVDSARAIAFE